jgi:hypothetical protein
MRAGRASDPVHPNGHIYAKMALNFIEKIAPAAAIPAAATGNRKRTWSASNRDEGEGSSSRHRQPDNPHQLWQLRARRGRQRQYWQPTAAARRLAGQSWRIRIQHWLRQKSSLEGRREGGGYEPAGKYKRGERAGKDRQEAAVAVDTPGEAAAASTRAASTASDLNLETILHMFTPAGIYFCPAHNQYNLYCNVYIKKISLKSL